MLIMYDQTVRDKLAVTWHIARIGDKVDLKLSLAAPLIYQVPNFGFFTCIVRVIMSTKKYFISSQTAAFFEKTIFEKVVHQANNISKFFFVQIILPLRHW